LQGDCFGLRESVYNVEGIFEQTSQKRSPKEVEVLATTGSKKAAGLPSSRVSVFARTASRAFEYEWNSRQDEAI
jgi:hypothetical protein